MYEVENAGKTEIYGIDAEGAFRISDRLTASGGVVWLPKRKVIEFESERRRESLVGKTLSRAPQWTATAALDAQDDFGLLNLLLKFEAPDGKWYVFAAGRDLTDEDYFNQVFLQSSPGYPDTYELGVGLHF